MSITRIDPGPRFCQAVVHGNTVYLAGQVADNPVPSVAKQTAQVLKRIDKYLKAAGTNKSKLLSVNIWLSDIRTFDEMNAEWEKWVSKDSKPVRATVEGRLAAPKYLVEIEGAGHLVFSDICLIGKDQGGLVQLTKEAGLDLGDDLLRLASDGCEPDKTDPADAFAAIDHFSVAFLRSELGIDPEPVGLDQATADSFDPPEIAFTSDPG